MSQVCKLNHLKILNLSNNNIEFMDGLKELKLLSWLGLANNKIKTIQQLNQCVHLEHLDLSGNFIQHLSDVSYLKNLKVLLLHRNNVETLRGCDRNFPTGQVFSNSDKNYYPNSHLNIQSKGTFKNYVDNMGG